MKFLMWLGIIALSVTAIVFAIIFLRSAYMRGQCRKYSIHYGRMIEVSYTHYTGGSPGCVRFSGIGRVILVDDDSLVLKVEHSEDINFMSNMEENPRTDGVTLYYSGIWLIKEIGHTTPDEFYKEISGVVK